MMNDLLTVFLHCGNSDDMSANVQQFHASGLNCRIYVLADTDPLPELPEEVGVLQVAGLLSTDAIKKASAHSKSPYTLLYAKRRPVRISKFGIQRMIQIAENTQSGMVYSDYYAIKDSQVVPNPVIDYQEGSLRDDFNFGSLMLFKSEAFNESVARMKQTYKFAGLYDLRLKMTQKYGLLHIPEFLYTENEADIRKSGEKQFDYVDPRNRHVQVEMEQACTDHLRETGAWLEPRFKEFNFDEDNFKNEISVIIPVKNRVKTISDAITSVLSQKTSFSYNLIVVDNHSTDGTTELISSFGRDNNKIIHIIPDQYDLGIGGCWNEAVFHELCGKFAVQLDSDDLYIDDNVLERITRAFYEQHCAMVVGTYRMVNFKLEDIPPGIIDHREWTPDNGRNNALRINGLGAPRAFYTPVLRTIRVPNVSYGEDYAVGLAISRYYRIGRIYEPLYLCRRWEGNSDAALDIQKLNTYNFYKDKIRTIEYKARQLYVRDG